MATVVKQLRSLEDAVGGDRHIRIVLHLGGSGPSGEGVDIEVYHIDDFLSADTSIYGDGHMKFQQH
jgi:hypothetical protein